MSSRFVGETRRANSLIESTVCGCAPLRKPQIPSRQHVRSTTQIATEKWPLIPVRLNFWSRLCVTQKHSTFPECDCESRVCSEKTWETRGSRLFTVVRCTTLTVLNGSQRYKDVSFEWAMTCRVTWLPVRARDHICVHAVQRANGRLEVSYCLVRIQSPLPLARGTLTTRWHKRIRNFFNALDVKIS